MSKLKLCALIIGLCVLYGVVMQSQLTLEPEERLAAVLILSMFAAGAAAVGAGAAVLVNGIKASRARRAPQAEASDDGPTPDDAEDVEPATDKTDEDESAADNDHLTAYQISILRARER